MPSGDSGSGLDGGAGDGGGVCGYDGGDLGAGGDGGGGRGGVSHSSPSHPSIQLQNQPDAVYSSPEPPGGPHRGGSGTMDCQKSTVEFKADSSSSNAANFALTAPIRSSIKPTCDDNSKILRLATDSESSAHVFETLTILEFSSIIDVENPVSNACTLWNVRLIASDKASSEFTSCSCFTVKTSMRSESPALDVPQYTSPSVIRTFSVFNTISEPSPELST